MEELGYFKNKIYYLTDAGKRTAVKEMKSRIYGIKEKKYYDIGFDCFLNFIEFNYDNTLDIALNFGVKSFDSAYTKYLKISKNKRNLELWFEASFTENNLTGKDIVDYFLSDDYSYIVEKFNLSYTICELTNFLYYNINAGCENVSSCKNKSI